MQSAKERENKKVHEEILQLLSKPTAKVSGGSFYQLYHGEFIIMSFKYLQAGSK